MDICVTPSEQGKGYGKILLNQFKGKDYLRNNVLNVSLIISTKMELISV